MIDNKIRTEWDLNGHFFDSIDDDRLSEGLIFDNKQIDEFINKYKGKIRDLSDDQFLDFINESDNLNGNFLKSHYYLSYLNSLNTQDQNVLKKIGELNNAWSENSLRLLFISEEIREIGREDLIRRSNLESYAPLRNYIVNLANDLKHTLSQDQERILIETDRVISIFEDTYTELTNSLEFEMFGQIRTESEVSADRHSSDESVRMEACRVILEKYGQHQIVLGNIYKAICKDNACNVRLRGYDDVMELRNISEEMDKEVVDMLLETIKSNYHLFHKYLKAKARLLGKDKIEFHDILAPVQANNIVDNIPFEQGLQMYLKHIGEFDQEFHDYSIDIFKSGRVSVFPGEDKMGGAYASYNKGFDSFVMLNHTPDFQSVMTLAHELGHAIHGWLSQSQPQSVYHPPLSLAETASIFNETLLFGEIIKEIDDKNRGHYIAKNLDDIFSTMFRQVMYVDFELECHRRTLSGEELSFSDFNEIWIRKSQELYGSDMELPEYAKYGWSTIPHIFATPFYCVTYSFGCLLSLSLIQVYRKTQDKEEFIRMYKNILKSGGSKRPRELMLDSGIDIASIEFYEDALSEIREMTQTIENIN